MTRESLAKSEAELLVLKSNEVPRLQQENERARLLLASMQSELDELKSESSSESVSGLTASHGRITSGEGIISRQDIYKANID